MGGGGEVEMSRRARGEAAAAASSPRPEAGSKGGLWREELGEAKRSSWEDMGGGGEWEVAK